jgi:hypothetical protein
MAKIEGKKVSTSGGLAERPFAWAASVGLSSAVGIDLSRSPLY